MKITINPKFNLGDKVWVSDRISKYTPCPTCKGKGDIKVVRTFKKEDKRYIKKDS